MIFLLLFIFFLNQKAVTIFEGAAMTVPYRISIGKNLTSIEKMDVHSILEATLQEIDNSLNNWNPQSEVSLLANLKFLETKKISPFLDHFLTRVDALVEISNFFFDPTISTLYQCWKKCLPSQQQILSLTQAVGWEKVHHQKGIFWKDHSDLCLDFCGIAKGYAVDLIAERLKGAGYSDFLVDWGGEMKASGKHPKGRAWTVAIAPVSFDQKRLLVPLEDMAIATSGDTFQHWKYEGKIYSHLINPKTSYPIEVREDSIASVTVVAKECLVADALASLLMLFPTKEEAKAVGNTLKKKFPELQFWIQTRLSDE